MKDKLLNAVPIVLFVITLGLGFTNRTTAGFWSASAVQLLTPLIAVCLTFFASQIKNDQREAKKHVEKIVETIQSIVSNENFYRISNVDDEERKKATQNQIQIVNRKMNNCIGILMQYSKRLRFESEATYIKDEFTKYRELIDASITDFETLSGLYLALQKNAENIDSKCDQISAKLFC